MATYILQRCYSDSEQKSGLGKKLAIGATSLAGTAATVYGISKGKIGTARMQQGVGKMIGNTGRLIGNENLMLRGAQSYGMGRARQLSNDLVSRGGRSLSQQQMISRADKVRDRYLGQLLK